MSRYELAKSLHVILAALWLGGGVLLAILIPRMKNAEPQAFLPAFGQAGKIGGPYFGTVGVLLLATGIWMVLDGPGWSFSDPWIVIGLAGYAISTIIGAAYYSRAGQRIGPMIAERGLADAEVQSQLRTYFTVSKIDVLIIALVVADMVIKPGV